MDINFNKPYLREDYLNFFQSKLLPEDFRIDEEKVDVDFKTKYITNATFLGKSDSLNLNVYEISHTSLFDARVGLSREIFKLMSRYRIDKSLVLFVPPDKNTFRLSLVTIDPKLDDKGVRVIYEYSNPRRFSFLLGADAKINTPYQFLVKKGRVTNSEDLISRFSVEVVNKEFYDKIALLFTELVGGKRKIGSSSKEFQGILKMPGGYDDQIYKEFAVRLIGRIIFCWFLKKKMSIDGIPLIPESILSSQSINPNRDYYHSNLEPLFFETLNTPIEERKTEFIKEPFNLIPFLNGGLFEPQAHDYYKLSKIGYSEYMNTLKIPNQWFKDLFFLLDLYNFTIDENTSIDIDLSVDPEMLGRIFENLLAEINPETGETARKATGSYYTPRPIVEHMVDESLRNYICLKTNIDQEIVRDLLDYSNENVELSNRDKTKIINSLDDLKILDPACGSGAFPIGILQKIILLLQKIDPESKIWLEKILDDVKDPGIHSLLENKLKDDLDLTNYTRKLGIIRKSIYGVDIQPIASDLSKLRCFLSLIVDEKIEDHKENRGIHPLPNLEFKFVCANTLIELPELKGQQIEIFEDLENIERLEKIRDSYFTSFGKEKLRLIEDFRSVQKEMFQKQLEDFQIWENNEFNKSQTNTLTNWKPFSNEPSTWFDPDWMFGLKKGFDILIGNPPYIGQKMNNAIFQEVKSTRLGKRFHQRRMDYFYFFIHKGLDLLKDKGILSFITTNYFLTATYADKLRKDLYDRSVITEFINFKEFKIFKSAQGQHNIITILQKDVDKNILCHISVVNEKGLSSDQLLYNILNKKNPDTEYYSVPNKDLYEGTNKYIQLEDRSNSNYLNKIENYGERLDSYCSVIQGIISGADKVSQSNIKNYRINIPKGTGIFVLSKSELEDLRLNEDELKLLKPWFKNSDIKKWVSSDHTSESLIYYSSKEEYKNIDKIKNHLSRFKIILINRNTRSGTGIVSVDDYDDFVKGVKKISYVMIASAFKRGDYYCLSYARDKNIFENEKIVVPQRSPKNLFAYNDIPWYASADVYYITSIDSQISLKYVLGLLNSKLYYQWLYHKGKRKGETLELYQKPLSEIPIKIISPDEQIPFIKIVDEILDKTNQGISVQEKENKLDLMIYKLYDLTFQEIISFDREFSFTEDEYNSFKNY